MNPVNRFTKTSRCISLRLFLVVAGVASIAAPAHAEWSTYQGDAAHTGYVPGNIDASNFSVRWFTSLSTSALGGMAVGGNGVYVQGPSASISAFNERTGSPLWTNPYTYGVANDQIFSISAPAYANGMVCYQIDGQYENNTFINSFNGVNAATGAKVFTTPYQAQWETYLNPTPFGGSIYTGGGEDGGIYSYNGASGAQNWLGYEGQFDAWTPAVDRKYAYSFTGSGDVEPVTGQFRMINLQTGATTYLVTDASFQSNLPKMNSALVLGPHNDAFTINDPGYVYPNYSAAGRLISFSTQADATHTPHIAWVASDHFMGQPTLANGVLYADDGGKVVALDELTGSTLWSWTPPTGAPIGPMIAIDNALFLSTNTTTYALDLTAHEADWSYAASGNLAFSDGTLFVAGSNGTLYAFSTPEPSSALGLVVLGFGLLIRSRHPRNRNVPGLIQN